MQKNFFFFFDILMIIIYAGLGFFLIFVQDINFIQPPYQTILGAVMLLYAAFRLITFIRKLRN